MTSFRIVDRNGVAIKERQNVLVHQDDDTRQAVVVSLTDSRTVNHPGYWVDVNIGGRGPEGMPSYLLEVMP